MKNTSIKWKILLLGLLLPTIIIGCANNKKPTAPEDPFEVVNRKIYVFNRVVDKVIIRPIAKGYDVVMPGPAQKGVTHFFSNLGEIPNVANDILQIDAPWTLTDAWRFIINSTIGIGGLFDVASIMGLPKHQLDFGLTLAKWGYKNSAYIMLPILGPSTVRDTIAIPANIATNVIFYFNPESDRYIIESVNVINNRANLLDTDKLVDEAFDPYVFIRDAYLQKRAHPNNNSTNNNSSSSNNDSNSSNANTDDSASNTSADNNKEIQNNTADQNQTKRTQKKLSSENNSALPNAEKIQISLIEKNV